MATGEKLDTLRTNVARLGTITYLDFAPGGPKYPDQHQLRVSGNWEEEGPGHFYLPWAAAVAFTRAGVAAPDGYDTRPKYNGQPKLKVLHKGRVMLLKDEQGRSRVTTVTPVDDAGEVIELAAQPDPAPGPQTAGAPAAAAAPAKAPAKAAPAAPAKAAPAAAAPAPTSEEAREDIIRRWVELKESYALAAYVAAHGLAHALGTVVSDLDQQAVQAGAATILIRAEQLGIPTFRGVYKAVTKENGTA